jgi:hypothetical protein
MSAPPIRIESKAWTDSRYTTLALELGLPASDADVALIRVAAIWRWQTEHYSAEAPTYSVSRAVVNGSLKSLDGARALVAADLAELEDDGRLRIKGGRDDNGKSRISWLWDDREEKRKAGRASAERRKAAGDPRGKDGRFEDLPNGGPTADQRRTNRTPTDPEQSTERQPSSPDSGLCPQDPDLSLGPRAGARDPGAPAPAAAGTLPSVPAMTPAPGPMAGYVTLALELLTAARAAIDPTANPAAWDMAFELALAAHLRPIPDDKREASIRHGVDVIAASVRAGLEKLDALRPMSLAGPRLWAKWQAGTVADVERSTRGRDGPGGPRPPAPASSIDATAQALRERGFIP